MAHLYVAGAKLPVDEVTSFTWREVMNAAGGYVLTIPGTEFDELGGELGSGVVLYDDDGNVEFGGIHHPGKLTYDSGPVSAPSWRKTVDALSRRTYQISGVSNVGALRWRRCVRGVLVDDNSRLDAGNPGVVIGDLIEAHIGDVSGDPNSDSPGWWRYWDNWTVNTASVGSGSNITTGYDDGGTRKHRFNNEELLAVCRKLIAETDVPYWIEAVSGHQADGTVTVGLAEYVASGFQVNLDDWPNVVEDHVPMAVTLPYADDLTTFTVPDSSVTIPGFTEGSDTLEEGKIELYVEGTQSDVDAAVDTGGLAVGVRLSADDAMPLHVGDTVTVGYGDTIEEVPVTEVVGTYAGGRITKQVFVGASRGFGQSVKTAYDALSGAIG